MSEFLYHVNLTFDDVINGMQLEHWALCAAILVALGYLWLRKGQA